VIAGSDKVVAKDTFNAIMVGRNDGPDEFVFKASTGSTQTQQKASIAGFNMGDSIDISSYLTEYGVVAKASMVGEKAVVIFKDTVSSNVNFTLELTFQEDVVPVDLLALYGTTT